MQKFNNPTVTEKSVTEKPIEKQHDGIVASIEDLGLQVVDNDNIQVALARPIRHIRRAAE